MRITVPADLLEQARKLPGMDGLTDAQVVALCLEAGMEHAKKENSLEALEKILNAQDSGFSRMVLEYAQAPVSYTHLDVYKRQIISWSSNSGSSDKRPCWPNAPD